MNIYVKTMFYKKQNSSPRSLTVSGSTCWHLIALWSLEAWELPGHEDCYPLPSYDSGGSCVFCAGSQ
ncbi:hypothetical protein E2C01_054074 [Portunus trituberculatus]|uniref:Uncharacterized protein n=1 Tax=Portunus trituberculatus TaxID=210409 RepID=A0A5B7GR21_PORTR|nr:hypothetical protein [Portunus trituberculatus]